ncbi:GRP family sugar transporter [Streptococcaceae bacterium ESL0729]|nr:GRP family sugar transporter [Streptococcaceae bacterium ESL0729]
MMYLIALIPAISWGLIGVGFAKTKATPEETTLGSMAGFLIFSTAVTLISTTNITLPIFAVGFASGFLLSLANIGQFSAMNELGVSKTVPLVAALQLILNSLLGAFIFHEWVGLVQWIFGIISIVLVIAGASMTSYQEASNKSKSNKDRSKFSKKGIASLLVAGIFGGLYSVLPKAYQFFNDINTGREFTDSLLLPQAIGGITGALLIYFFVRKENPFKALATSPVVKSLFVGFLWAIGNMCLLISSTSSLGLATAFTFSQLNLVIGGFSGIYILHESKTKKEFRHFLLGILLVVAGAVITALI